MKAIAWLMLAAATPAHADDALEAHAKAEATQSWLELDPTLPTTLEGVAGVQHQITRDAIAIDRKTTLHLELDQWSNEDGALPALDVRGQGWHATARITRDLGFATLTLRAALSDVDTQFGRGRYHELGGSLIRTVKRKGGKKAWYGVTASRTRWQGPKDEIPAGQADGTQVLFVLGWTF